MSDVASTGTVLVPTASGCTVVVGWGGGRSARREGVLRRAAAEALGLPQADLALASATCPDCGERHGAPVAVGASAPVHLSLAHAGSASVAAASASARLGVDAVRADASTEGLDALLEGIPDPLRHWTRIEAVLKADGRGLRVDPSRIRFSGDRMRARLDGVDYRLEELAVDGILITLAAARGGGA